jgi:hypothetical protein
MIRDEVVIASGAEDRTKTTMRHAGSGSRWKEIRGDDADGRGRTYKESCDLLIIKNREKQGQEKERKWVA